MKKFLVGSSALVAIAVVAVVTANSAQSSPGRNVKSTPSTAAAADTTSTAPSTTTSSTTTTTTVPKPVDPMEGVAFLGSEGRYVKAYGADGKAMRTIVTAFEGRLVTKVQLMSDHHTVWYLTTPDWRAENTVYKCDDVVRLDLATNARTVIAHAADFSATDDGSRVALTAINNGDANCDGNTYVDTLNVVRDVNTGAESRITGEYSYNLVISPDGRTLVKTNCTSEADDMCRYPLAGSSVPSTLGAPITLTPVGNQQLSFLKLVPNSAGLFAIVDPQAQNCGCGGRGDRYDNDITVRRLDWNNLAGEGTEVFRIQGPLYFDNVIPAGYSLYAMGSDSTDSAPALYRINALGAATVRYLPASPDYPFGSQITFTAIPQFVS